MNIKQPAENNRITDLPVKKKKKPTTAELMAQQAEAAQQEAATMEAASPIDTHIAATEEQAKNKKKLKSFYCTETVFDQLAELAQYRSIGLGKKNSRNQPIGAGTLIDIAAAEYLERHMDELNQWRQLMQPVKNGIPWTYTTTAPDGTIVTENHGREE